MLKKLQKQNKRFVDCRCTLQSVDSLNFVTLVLFTISLFKLCIAEDHKVQNVNAEMPAMYRLCVTDVGV